MPIYAFSCAHPHPNGESFESEGYLPSYDSENPTCGICGNVTERVWRGRQYHGEASGWPLVTKMLTGVETRYENRGEWERAVKAKGYRIRDDASWLDEDIGDPVYNWRSRKTEYPDRHTVLGGKGTWF